MDKFNNYIYCIAASPNFKNDGIVFAARQDGLFRSIDGGQSWEDAYSSLNLNVTLPTTYVVVTPSENEELWVFAAVNGSVLRSKDSGNNWEVHTIKKSPIAISALVVSPNFKQDGLIFAGTMRDGIYYSRNFGVIWSDWNFGLFDPNINALAVAPCFTEKISVIVGTQCGVFYSNNSGLSWFDMDFPIHDVPVSSVAISNDGMFYGGSLRTGLFASRNCGEPWNFILNEPVLQIITLDEKGILVVQDDKIHLSEDGWNNWQVISSAKINKSIAYVTVPYWDLQDKSLLIGLIDGHIKHVLV